MYKLVRYDDNGFTKVTLSEFETEAAANEAFENAVLSSESGDVFNVECEA